MADLCAIAVVERPLGDTRCNVHTALEGLQTLLIPGFLLAAMMRTQQSSTLSLSEAAIQLSCANDEHERTKQGQRPV